MCKRSVRGMEAWKHERIWRFEPPSVKLSSIFPFGESLESFNIPPSDHVICWVIQKSPMILKIENAIKIGIVEKDGGSPIIPVARAVLWTQIIMISWIKRQIMLSSPTSLVTCRMDLFLDNDFSFEQLSYFNQYNQDTIILPRPK